MNAYEKKAVNLLKRYNELHRISRNTPWIPVDPPVRAGWDRFFVVRHDLVKQKLGEKVAKVLPIINSHIFCRNKNFLHKDWLTGKIVPIEHVTQDLTEREYNALDKEFLIWFTPRMKKSRWMRHSYKVYEFNRPQFLDYQTKPHYITHRPVHDGELNAELDYIHDMLWGGLCPPVMRVSFRSGGRYWEWDGPRDIKKKRMDITTKEQLMEASGTVGE